MSDPTPFFILAAGGTGGHIFPAEALARELLGRGYRVALMTDQRGAVFSDDLPVAVYRTRASALGKGILGKIRSVMEMGIGVLQARRKLRQLRPSVVVGFGGCPSVPTLYAAAQIGIPLALANLKLIPVSLVPLGKEIVPVSSPAQFGRVPA